MLGIFLGFLAVSYALARRIDVGRLVLSDEPLIFYIPTSPYPVSTQSSSPVKDLYRLN
jgi:hypothetical protein